ncbi:MAG: acyltransferase family protein, partial [Azoarcus sp.]|nr:acyltransferase family protein [Azoarcus sp.]
MNHPAPHLAYRPDIDGLRALAVLSVVVFHAFPDLLPGGFIGVDVFFVISGYLISLIIFKLHAAGGFGFADFYARRIRRIFPVLLVVVFASLVLGWSVLLPDEYAQLGKHGLAGMGFVANVVFWQEAGYFDTAAELKPFLHLWSLGIEEQFYIVWPAIVAWAWHRGISPGRVIAVLGAASLVACVLLTPTHPQAGFFLPPTRAWELLGGALLAWRLHHRGALFDGTASRLASGVSLVGLGLLLLGLGLIDGTRDFPGVWAVLPVSGAVLMIAAGNAGVINRRVLAHPLMVWFGLISFPLYLWHWPLLSFVRIVFAERVTATLLLATVALAVLLAWLSYRLLETPVRHHGGRRAVIGLVIASVVAAALAGNIMSRDGLAFRLQDAQAKREAQALEWPDVLRSDVECSEKVVHGRLGGWCLVADPTRAPTAMIIGDSHANHYFWALRDGVLEQGGNLLQIANGACMPVAGIDLLKEGRYFGCPKVIDAAIEYAIAAPEVETVFLAARWGGYIAKRELRDWETGERD